MIVQTLEYAGKFGFGDNVATFQSPVKPESFSEVAPGTNGEYWLKLVCAKH
jgi:hypothetical protein